MKPAFLDFSSSQLDSLAFLWALPKVRHKSPKLQFDCQDVARLSQETFNLNDNCCFWRWLPPPYREYSSFPVAQADPVLHPGTLS